MIDEIALVVEGGAMRGIFSAGVLDRLHEAGLTDFGLAIGTSAGAANLASFVAGQHGRNLRCYTELMSQKQMFNWPRFLRGGHFMDLDWLWDELARTDPLDEGAIAASNSPLYSVATCFETGAALYHQQSGDVHEGVKGGCALPVLYRGPVYFRSTPIVDGGIADSVPVQEAYRRGFRKILVIRSRPIAVVKKQAPVDHLAGFLARKTPELAAAIRTTAYRYGEMVEFVTNPPADLHLIQVAPPSSMATSRTTQDVPTLEADYALGRAATEQAMGALNAMLAS